MRVALVALTGQPGPVGDCHLACGTATVLVGRNDSGKTFQWIGVSLTATYLGVREDQPLGAQFALLAGPSLVVKLAEQALFGTWELDHFLHVFEGNAAYVIGWSLGDGLYPFLTLLGLRLAVRRITRLMPV
jgi:hypothetical protein